MLSPGVNKIPPNLYSTFELGVDQEKSLNVSEVSSQVNSEPGVQSTSGTESPEAESLMVSIKNYKVKNTEEVRDCS
ncbi:hypothetical protein A2U01_0068662 [Trifolium medium]|uniref:Uncharacterized protein n=1 Tax=Trifolium medium TaxID=97028 RepID=A0A392SHK2_9FABA|nr:hypothetical protein [Trifolium medium]